jgi:hypothetical protein
MHDPVRGEVLGADRVKRQVEPAERGSGVAGHHRRRVQPVPSVKQPSEQQQPDQRVDAGKYRRGIRHG